MNLLSRLGVRLPMIQAPMAGVSTPEMAIAVSEAGGLGSIAVGASDVAGARAMIEAVRAGTRRAFNVNVFAHAEPRVDPAREARWGAALEPLFRAFGAAPPDRLRTIYKSFTVDEEMQALLVALAPPVVSFHFGLPDAGCIAALKTAGCALLATATSLEEARAIAAAGIDAVVAQGWEAGGHRGVFDTSAPDARLGTLALVRLLAQHTGLPVIAAGGIMDGPGVRAALDLGAIAAQLGTAFVACPESAADTAYRAALLGPAAWRTTMTAAVSGRPARCLGNRFTAWAESDEGRAAVTDSLPDYPRTYDAGKALHASARARGESGFGAQWAGQGAPLARTMGAGELVRTLAAELATGSHRAPPTA